MKFIAKDGQVFDNASKCEDHERALDKLNQQRTLIEEYVTWLESQDVGDRARTRIEKEIVRWETWRLTRDLQS